MLYRKLNIPARWPWVFPIFWTFDWRSTSNIDGDISIKNLTYFVTYVNDVMNTRLHKCSHNLLVHMHRKFDYDIFACFSVIMKNVMLFIKDYRGPTFRPPCDVVGDVIIMKNTFYGIIWDNLFISEVKLKLRLIFQNFQNVRHFELAINFFSGCDTWSWMYQKDSH